MVSSPHLRAGSRLARLAVPSIVVAWGLLTVALFIVYGGKAVDDFFVTYRYAKNLAILGHGFVFNPGERVLGLTNPGMGLLLAGLYLLTRISIPVLATLVCGLSLFAAAVVLLREAGRHGRRAEAALGGTLMLASAYIWVAQGGAAPVVVALLLCAAAVMERFPWLAGTLAGLAVWFRPDAGLGVGLLGLLQWGRQRRLPWRYGVAGAAVILAGALGLWLYFGTPLPITFESKQLLSELERGNHSAERFWPSAWPLWKRKSGGLGLALVICGVLGQLALWHRSGRSGRILALYGTGLAIAYPLLGVPYYVWYTIPVAVALFYGLAYLMGVVVRAAARIPGGRTLRTILVVLTLVLWATLLLSYARTTLHAHRTFVWNDRLWAYRDAALWIRDHGGPEDDIAYLEIGVVGYYSDRTLEDLLGLVTPRSLPYVAKKNLAGAFLAKPTTFVLHHDQRFRMRAIVERPWFTAAYEEAARFAAPRNRGNVIVYRRRPGAELPPPPKL